MKIITSYPIIKNGKVVANNCYNTTLDYSSISGTKNIPKDSPIFQPLNLPKVGGSSGVGKTGRNIDFESLADKASGAIRGLGGIVGAIKKPKGTAAPTPEPVQQPQAQGMSTGVKIAIGVGAVAVIGALIYFAKK